MKLAVVCPESYTGILLDTASGFHLVEATRLKTRAHVMTWSNLHDRGHFIMLDNGAAETVKVLHGHAFEENGIKEIGKPIDFTNVIDLGADIGADEIILPDMKLERSWTYLNTKKWAASIPAFKRVVVPQGRDWGEWTASLHELVSLDVMTICVTKDYEELPGGRIKALDIIQRAGYNWTHHVHLLGLKLLPGVGVRTEVMRIVERFPWVRSLDTAAPISFAQHDVDISNHRVKCSLDWNAPVNEALAVQNIWTLREWCNGHN
jgi:hypothetical protein